MDPSHVPDPEPFQGEALAARLALELLSIVSSSRLSLYVQITSNVMTLPTLLVIVLIHVCLYVHGTAETPDGVAELPDTQTAHQTDIKGTYYISIQSVALAQLVNCVDFKLRVVCNKQSMA